jgi:hypothetical protein
MRREGLGFDPLPGHLFFLTRNVTAITCTLKPQKPVVPRHFPSGFGRLRFNHIGRVSISNMGFRPSARYIHWHGSNSDSSFRHTWDAPFLDLKLAVRLWRNVGRTAWKLWRR